MGDDGFWRLVDAVFGEDGAGIGKAGRVGTVGPEAITAGSSPGTSEIASVITGAGAAAAELDGTDVEISCVMPAVVNTELAAGLKDVRGVKNLEPEEVADAIVEALETNRFEVWVPRSSAAISTVLNLVPRRGRQAIARFMKADQVLAAADPADRTAYEERAAHSEPGLDPEDEAVSAKRD